MTRRLRARAQPSDSRRRAAGALLLAVSTAGTAAAAFAQDAALEVTLQVLDDVTAIEGVLMPLEEEPAHGTEAGADSTPAPEVSAPTPEASPADEPAVEVVR